MNVKLQKAIVNTLSGFESFSENVMEKWFSEMDENIKIHEQELKLKMIESCVDYFFKNYSMEGENKNTIIKDISDSCNKIKFTKLKVSCPNFMINHKHTEKDMEEYKDTDYKKFIFKINKKKVPNNEKKQKKTTPYFLFQQELRPKLKLKGLNSKEISEELKNTWATFKNNEVEIKKLQEKAEQIDKENINLPIKKQSDGLGRIAYHIFASNEKLEYKERKPNADKKEIQEHVSKEWAIIKNNEKQYNAYIEQAKIKKNSKESNKDSEDEEEEKDKPKRGKGKKKDAKKEDKPKNKPKKSKEKKEVKEEESEEEIVISDPEFSNQSDEDDDE